MAPTLAAFRELQPGVSMIDWSQYDFIDLGCSKGGSLKHCMDRFDVKRGIGVDINPAKVALTEAAGYEAVVADATELEGNGTVSFVSMMNFLEHLPDIGVVDAVITAASKVARDFLYIRNPSFEGMEWSDVTGFQQYWWHWPFHPSKIKVSDLCAIFDRNNLGPYSIRFVDRVTDTSHETVVPMSLGNRVGGKAARDYPRDKTTPLPDGLFRRQDIFVALRPFAPEEWTSLTKPSRADRKFPPVAPLGRAKE
jgi:hypothetical protein